MLKSITIGDIEKNFLRIYTHKVCYKKQKIFSLLHVTKRLFQKPRIWIETHDYISGKFPEFSRHNRATKKGSLDYVWILNISKIHRFKRAPKQKLKSTTSGNIEKNFLRLYTLKVCWKNKRSFLSSM